MLVDTHCHIDGEEYENKAEVVARANENGVGVLINSGSNVKTSLNSFELSKTFSSVYFSAGVHPDDAENFDERAYSKIKELSNDDKCVGIGEIGLDYHYTPYDESKQKSAFIKQIELANEVRLPVIIHSRDATSDTLEIVKKYKPYSGTMHCFSGSVETAKEYLNLGFYLSFGGTLTFKNNVKTVEVLKNTPLDRILTETDSPYLSPEPKRGRLNEPANVRFVVEKIAQIKNIAIEEVERIVYENTLRLFHKIK
ncbi:MAG: TatD family hydrolase [Clostridia bacterium]|nr:TatD family hydrolase [Clostridia bacterium]